MGCLCVSPAHSWPFLQPVSQYVAVHEAALLEAAAGEPTDFFSSEVTSGKRRHEG